MRRPLGIVVIASLILVFGTMCKGKSRSRGGGGDVPVAGCGDLLTETLEGKGSASPDFSDADAAAFYKVDPIPPEATTVTITLTSTTGDADLHLASPGTTPGSKQASSYIISSQEVSPGVDRIEISLVGLVSPGATLTGSTLTNYRNRGNRIPFAVWGVQPGTLFDLQVACDNAVNLPCGLDVDASLPGSGTAPPDFSAGTEVHFFEVQGLPAAPGTVSILATSRKGDVNLYLGMPGLAAPSVDPAEYVFSSTAPTSASANDLILLDDMGTHDVFGFTNPLLTLQDYNSGGGNLWFAVAGLAASNDYTLRVTCSPVDPIACGNLRNGSVGGSALSPPDLADPLETRFFQIDPIPPTASTVTITLDSTVGDADLHLLGPGIPPGSDIFGEYVFSAAERLPATQDQIIIDFTGIQDGVGNSTAAVNLDDYLQAATPVGLAVSGYEPTSSFQISITCVALPPVIPIDCGGSVSFVLGGNGGGPPDLANTTQNIWFELTSIPPGTGRIEVRIPSLAGDVDLHLLAPGIPPGSQNLGDYPIESGAGFWADNLTICPGGVATLNGRNTSITLADYVSSPENLSFVVAGVAQQSSFTLQVNCTAPTAGSPLVVACGSLTPDQVAGSGLFPPDFDNPAEVKFYEVPLSEVQSVVTALRLRIDLAGGDADMYLAAPGVTPGSTCLADYVFRDISGGASDWIRIRNSGLDNSGGGTNANFTLADYQAASTNLSFVVAGWTASTNYDLSIICN